MFPFIIQGQNIVIVIDGKDHTINKTHLLYDKLKKAIADNNEDAVRDLVEPKKIIVSYGSGNVSIDGDSFSWKGAPMHNALSNKMIEMLNEGFPIDPMVAFMENLMRNPSKRAVDELYGFLEKGALPITPDGHFLAYKKVQDSYLDCHSGTISNHVGAVVEMDRNAVDDDKDRTCSAGLHFCSREYLKSFGGSRTMVLKINPMDVVSIPSDYNDSKGRTCRYEVIGELDKPSETTFTRAVQSNGDGIKKVELKTGSSDFYRGYSAGFNNEYRTGDDAVSLKNYTEGYNKGSKDRAIGVERYRYVAPALSAAWPHPAK